MKAVRKNPGMPPEIVDVDNTLEALQKEVGGYIEFFQIASDCTIICNEEGKLLPLEPNLLFCGEAFFWNGAGRGRAGRELLLFAAGGS